MKFTLGDFLGLLVRMASKKPWIALFVIGEFIRKVFRDIVGIVRRRDPKDDDGRR